MSSKAGRIYLTSLLVLMLLVIFSSCGEADKPKPSVAHARYDTVVVHDTIRMMLYDILENDSNENQ